MWELEVNVWGCKAPPTLHFSVRVAPCLAGRANILYSPTVGGAQTSLLFDLGSRTCSDHPVAWISPPQKSKGGQSCSPRRHVTAVPLGSGISSGRGRVMPRFGEGKACCSHQRGSLARKGSSRELECQGHEEMSYLQCVAHRPLRNGIMARDTCL